MERIDTIANELTTDTLERGYAGMTDAEAATTAAFGYDNRLQAIFDAA